MKINAILFDLDGTLFPSEHLLRLRHSRGSGAAVNELRTLDILPYDGVKAVLSELANDFLLGLVTSAPRWYTDILLNQHLTGAWFDSIVTYDDVEQIKPDPEPLLAAVQGLRVAPSEAVYVGDDQVDIDASRHAGTGFIWAAWGHGRRRIATGVSARRPGDIIEMVRKWNE